ERNIGLAATLNEGLGLASGDLIARMDQDDIALPDRLNRQRQFMQLHPEILVVGSAVYHMGARPQFDRLISTPTTPQAVRDVFPDKNCIYPPSAMPRPKPILALGGYRSKFRNEKDYDLWLRVSNSLAIVNMPEPLLRYRFSVSGMTLSRKWEQ